MAHRDTEWGKFLSYKPFKLDSYAESFKKLLTVGTVSSDANALIQIREQLKKEYEFLMRRLALVNKE